MNVRKISIGLTRQGHPLNIWEFLPTDSLEKWLIILGAVHGDEVEGVWLCDWAIENWTKSFNSKKIGVIVWPKVNPEGVAFKQRWNSLGVDLNRNLPSKDWTGEILNPRYPPGAFACSEPENQALVKLIERHSPIAILSVHSFSNFQVNVNGPSIEWGEKLSKLCGYPVTKDIGYPTPGSLGTYAGFEKQIPTITLEIERGISKEKVIETHSAVLQETLNYWNEKLCAQN